MGSKVLKIYSPLISPRLEYVSEVIFSAILGLEYELTTDRRKIGGSPAIIYSNEKINDQFIIRPSGLLMSTGIEPLVPEVSCISDMPVIFPTDEGILPFDVFSASFYMLTRYEEYLPFKPDAHGRFPGSGSLACRGSFLHLPVVDIWARFLANSLVKHFPVLTIRHNEFSALLTVDVDQPFAYRSRGLLRTMGGFVKGIAGGGVPPSERLRTMMGKEDDPYDNFAFIEETAEKHKSDLLFFFPVGDQGEYDHNPSFRDHNYDEIIKSADTLFCSGLHPSYRSFGRQNVLRIEIERYKHITGHLPDKTRQHWLLLKMPDTYRSFAEAGIKYDYTMGYADEPGFRAGIARPYKFYDLDREKSTGLTIVPFQVMDGTLRQYRNMSPAAAIETIRELISVTRKVGGQFISVWHNTSLSERNGWEGWREVFEATLLHQTR